MKSSETLAPRERAVWLMLLLVGMALAFTLGEHGRDDDAIDRALRQTSGWVVAGESGVYFDLFGQEHRLQCSELACRPH